MPDLVSRDELLAYASELGASITAHQLVRWHKYGLLPRPKRVGRGRGAGTMSLYPWSAVSQALFVARALRVYKSLPVAAWAAWAEGYPVTACVRRRLLRQADAALAQVQADLRGFEEEVPENAIDRAARQPVSRGFRRIPRAFRPTMAKMLLEARAGRFQSSKYDEDDFKQVSRSFPGAANSSADGRQCVSFALEFLSSDINEARIVRALQSMSDDRFEHVRDDAHRIWRQAQEMANCELGPLPYGVFMMVFLATHVSPQCRMWLSLLRRMVRNQGYDSLEVALRETKAKKDAAVRSTNEEAAVALQ